MSGDHEAPAPPPLTTRWDDLGSGWRVALVRLTIGQRTWTTLGLKTPWGRTWPLGSRSPAWTLEAAGGVN